MAGWVRTYLAIRLFIILSHLKQLGVPSEGNDTPPPLQQRTPHRARPVLSSSQKAWIT